MQTSLAMMPTTANYHLDRFRANGWVESFQRAAPRYGRNLIRWRFTEAGKTAVQYHIDALRRAAAASGYLPTGDDLKYPFDKDGADCEPRFAEPDEPSARDPYGNAIPG
jgi:hypothetical protein